MRLFTNTIYELPPKWGPQNYSRKSFLSEIPLFKRLGKIKHQWNVAGVYVNLTRDGSLLEVDKTG